MMLRRFQFEITLSSLILCGLVSLFFYFWHFREVPRDGARHRLNALSNQANDSSGKISRLREMA